MFKVVNKRKEQSSSTSININVENVVKSKENVIVSELSGTRGLIDHENHRFGVLQGSSSLSAISCHKI